MFKSKFNLYNSEWLELVFSDRNKNYGAYDLRKHYNSNILKALFFTATLLAILLSGMSFLLRQHYEPIAIPKYEKENLINLSDLIEAKVLPEKQLNKIKKQASGAMQKIVAASSQTMKAVNDDLAKTDPKPIMATNALSGTEDIPGDLPALNTVAGGGNGTKPGVENGSSNVETNMTMLEKLPEFPGGMEAWAKFLSKNIRYPEAAASDGISGKVFMSFIIEKDGRITDIQVLRAAGNGFDEEAKRVLKMAPQWKPGIQNGKAVRVRYTIPINFSIQP